MADKDNPEHRSKTDDDKDFGLPEVKVTPLQAKEKSGSVPSDPEPNKPEAAPVIDKSAEKAPESEPEKVEEETVIAVAPKEEEAVKGSPVEKVGRSNKWAWISVVLLLLLLCLGAFWIWYYNEADTAREPELITEVEVIEEPAPIEEEIEAVEEEPEPPALTRIQSRASSPRYFVVVGSFIDEDMALDYSARLNRQNINTYIVYPYGEIAFYRLAIGEFETLAQAVELLEEQQANFKENLWVLKY